MKIDEVESTTKKARVATHTHIKVIFYFFVLVLFFFVSLSRINKMRTKVVASMMRSIVIGDAFFFSLALAHASYFLFLRATICVFAKRTTGSRGKRER